MGADSLISAGSIAGELKEILSQALAMSRPRLARPIAFIEQKVPDFVQLAEILRLSADSGYWTNFGPVCSLLESSLEHYLKLPPSRAVVMCSSGTAALLALIGLKEHQRRPQFTVGGLGIWFSFYVSGAAGQRRSAGLR